MHDPAEESTERRGSGTRISCRRAYATSEPEPDAAEPTAESAERLVEVSGPSGVVSPKASMEICEWSILTLSGMGPIWPPPLTC